MEFSHQTDIEDLSTFVPQDEMVQTIVAGYVEEGKLDDEMAGEEWREDYE